MEEKLKERNEKKREIEKNTGRVIEEREEVVRVKAARGRGKEGKNRDIERNRGESEEYRSEKDEDNFQFKF